jgi:hypothetical protein
MKKYLRFMSMGMLAAALLVVVSACSSTPKESATDQDSKPAVSTEEMSAETPVASSDGSSAMVKIDSTKLLQDNGSGAAGDEVTSFKASDHKQYFAVQLSDFLKPGSEVKWVFTAVDTTAGKNVNITEVNTKVVIGNVLNANLSLDKDFPVGSYKADITVDGKPLGSIEYSVTE